MYVLFLIILIPLLNLVNLFVSAATLYLATNDFASKAATQPNYSSALNAMAAESYKFQATGFARFLHMVPTGGFSGCGDDLYVLATDLGTGAVTSSQADMPLSQAIDTPASMYELSVQSVYEVSPLISMSALPLLGSVPGLGKPAALTFKATRPVEQPGGFQPPTPPRPQAAVQENFADPRGGRKPGNPPPPTPITWRTPSI
jgi:hypothetical protein